MEHSPVTERARAGVKAAKRRRGVKVGRKLKLAPQQIGPVPERIAQDGRPGHAAAFFTVSGATLYRALPA